MLIGLCRGPQLPSFKARLLDGHAWNLRIQFPASTNVLNDLAKATKALDGKKWLQIALEMGLDFGWRNVRSSMRFLKLCLQIALEWLNECCMGNVVGRKPQHETSCFSV